VAAFEAYYDESGSRRHLTFAGFVADANDWANFSECWAALQTTYGISHFHTKTFRNRQSKLYQHLSRTQRRDLLANVIQLIKRHVLLGASVSLDLEMFDRLKTPSDGGRCGSAYAICALLCTVNVVGVALTGRGLRSEHWSVFIESGDKNAGDALRLLNLYKQLSDPINLGKYDRVFNKDRSRLRDAPLKLDTVAISGKTTTPALQAADLLAYCSAAAELPNHQFSEVVGRSLAEEVPIFGVRLTENETSEALDASRRFFAEHSRLAKQRKGQKRTLRELGIPFTEVSDILEIQFPDAASDEEITRVMARLHVGRV
jgi:Protein of unknown function (DUF3800)